MIKFSEPIDDKRRDEIIDAIAKRVQQFGLIVPAIFFLEMNKPISYIGGQAMHFFAPIVGVFFETFEDYAYFFDNRQNVELLIQKLESLAMEEEAQRKKEKEAKKKARMAKKAGQQKGSILDEAMKIDEKSRDSNEGHVNPPN